MSAPTVTGQPKREKDVAGWAVLVGAGVTTICFNIYHSTHKGNLATLLAVLLGLAPVGLAMGLSHMGVRHRSNPWMMAAMFAVMIGAMALSMGAVAAVVRPTTGPYLCWLFGAVLDSAALLALWGIISDPKAVAPKGAPEGELDPELEVASDPEVSPPLPPGSATVLPGGSDPEVPPPLPPGTSARKPPRKRATTSARKPRRTSAPPVPDMDNESWALQILATDPGMSGSELGRRMGKSDRYGRDLIKRLSTAVPDPGEGGQR